MFSNPIYTRLFNNPVQILIICFQLVNYVMCSYFLRFHCPSREPSLDFDVILPLGDDVQLSVAEYRNKLYEVLSSNVPKSSSSMFPAIPAHT